MKYPTIKRLISIVLVVVFIPLLSGCINQDTISIDDQYIEPVSGKKAELAQIELLITPDELVERYDAYMNYRVRGNGKYLYLAGVINSDFPHNLEKIFAKAPNVKWLVLTNVPGSMDDDANLLGAMQIRERGMNTYIPQGGSVASGGTDLFTAGVERIVAANAILGVHSWGGTNNYGEEISGTDVPRDNPMHQPYLNYYQAVGIPAKFYWFTLKAADADDIYNMTVGEIKEYNIATEIVP